MLFHLVALFLFVSQIAHKRKVLPKLVSSLLLPSGFEGEIPDHGCSPNVGVEEETNTQ